MLFNTLITLTSVAAIAFPGTVSNTCLPIAKDCSFYSKCVESSLTCGPDGYALGYGGKYCQKFKDNEPKFSTGGQEWIWSVMSCLQDKLIPLVQGQMTLTCPGLRSFAYDTHPPCYTQPGKSICSLPPQDWLRLLVIIRDELDDVATYKQMIAVAKSCGKQYIHDILRLLKLIKE